MKVAALLALAGIALILFGVLLFTTGGCRIEACRPAIQLVAFYAGVGLLGAALLRAGVPWLRSFPADATAGERALVGGAIGLIVVAFWWWATTPQARALAGS